MEFSSALLNSISKSKTFFGMANQIGIFYMPIKLKHFHYSYKIKIQYLTKYTSGIKCMALFLIFIIALFSVLPQEIC